MSARPVLHVTNWSSRKLHGPGRRFTIMAKPRSWEHGDGVVSLLVPDVADLAAMRAGTIDVREYRRRFLALPRPLLGDGTSPLAPKELTTRDWEVQSGDTLCCACSVAAAERGECHRVWAAELLVAAGWTVVLDGVVQGVAPRCD